MRYGVCVCVCPMSYGQAQYLIRCLLHSRAKSTPASRSRSSWESPLHTSSVLVSSAKAWDSNIKNHLPSKPRTPFQQNLLVQTTSKTTYAKTVHRPGHFRGDCQVDQMKPVGHYNGNVKTRNPYPRVWSATMDYEVCSGLEGRSMRSIFTKEGVQMWPTQGSITVHTTFLTHPTRCQLQSTLYVLLVPFQTKQHSSEPTTDSSRSSPWKWIVIRIDGHELPSLKLRKWVHNPRIQTVICSCHSTTHIHAVNQKPVIPWAPSTAQWWSHSEYCEASPSVAFTIISMHHNWKDTTEISILRLHKLKGSSTTFFKTKNISVSLQTSFSSWQNGMVLKPWSGSLCFPKLFQFLGHSLLEKKDFNIWYKS